MTVYLLDYGNYDDDECGISAFRVEEPAASFNVNISENKETGYQNAADFEMSFADEIEKEISGILNNDDTEFLESKFKRRQQKAIYEELEKHLARIDKEQFLKTNFFTS